MAFQTGAERSLAVVLICTSLTIPDVQHVFMGFDLTSVCGIDCGNFLLHPLSSFYLFSISSVQFSSVQSLSRVGLFATP